jgi:hypothetical protein
MLASLQKTVLENTQGSANDLIPEGPEVPEEELDTWTQTITKQLQAAAREGKSEYDMVIAKHYLDRYGVPGGPPYDKHERWNGYDVGLPSVKYWWVAHAEAIEKAPDNVRLLAEKRRNALLLDFLGQLAQEWQRHSDVTVCVMDSSTSTYYAKRYPTDDDSHTSISNVKGLKFSWPFVLTEGSTADLTSDLRDAERQVAKYEFKLRAARGEVDKALKKLRESEPPNKKIKA